MKRSELIQKLIHLYIDIDSDASFYEVIDTIIGGAERLGMTPIPKGMSKEGFKILKYELEYKQGISFEWEEE